MRTHLGYSGRLDGSVRSYRSGHGSTRFQWHGGSQNVEQHLKQNQERIQSALEAPRRSVSRQFPHYEAQVERAGMNEQPLDDVVVTPQVSSSHAAGFIHMSKTSFHSFSALTQQPFSALSPDPSPVLINR